MTETTAQTSSYSGLDRRIAENGSASLWVGDKALLRAYEPEDAEQFELIRNSTDERSAWVIRQPRSRVAVKKSFQDMAEVQFEPSTLQFDLVIARREDNLMVGAINIHTADQINGIFSYGIGLEAGHKGKGYGAEAVLLVMRFMFDERRFQKCEVGAYAFNTASLAMHRKLGFVEEGRLRRHVFMGGEYHDGINFGMTVEEFHELYTALRPVL